MMIFARSFLERPRGFAERVFRFVVIAFPIFFLVLVSCAAPSRTPPAPSTIAPTPRPLPLLTSSPTRVLTPIVPVTPTPIPTLEPLAVPSAPRGAEMLTWSPDPGRTGWVGSVDSQPHRRERNLLSGISQGQVLLSLVQFDVQNLSPNSKVLFAALEITGRDAANLGTTGEWSVDLIDSGAIKDDDTTFASISKLPALASLGNFGPQNIAVGLTKRLVLTQPQLPLTTKQIELGKITFRIRGPSSGSDNLFVWEAGPGRGEPTLYLLAVPAPFVVVINTPTPQDVFAAATLVTNQTAQARALGTPTPLPRLVVTATPPPVYNVITSVPTPANDQARIATAVYATAVAVTTGTFTPLPPNWVTATPRPLLIPRELLTVAPTPTPVPATPSVVDWARRPLLPIFYNKIIFLEGPRASPNVWVMDPDGSNVQLLTDKQYYDIAKARDVISPDGGMLLYNDPYVGGLQIWGQDLNIPNIPARVLTHNRGNLAFGPAWSADGKKIAYVSDEGGAQDIWVYTLQPQDWRRITFANGKDWFWTQFPSWSPDGTKLVVSSDRGHAATFSEIWVMNPDGGDMRKLGNGIWDAYSPVWVKWRQ